MKWQHVQVGFFAIYPRVWWKMEGWTSSERKQDFSWMLYHGISPVWVFGFNSFNGWLIKYGTLFIQDHTPWFSKNTFLANKLIKTSRENGHLCYKHIFTLSKYIFNCSIRKLATCLLSSYKYTFKQSSCVFVPLQLNIFPGLYYSKTMCTLHWEWHIQSCKRKGKNKDYVHEIILID